MDFEALVKAKFDEAYAASEHPKKFFLTENGRGVVDGGEMYNALLHDVLDVVQKAMVGILKDSHHTHWHIQTTNSCATLCRQDRQKERPHTNAIAPLLYSDCFVMKRLKLPEHARKHL